MVKNVKGVELPFNTHEEKADWYSTQGQPDMEIDLMSKGGGPNIEGKDVVFFAQLLPFCEAAGVKTVLDVGAAQGRYSAWFWEKGMDVTAVEISPSRTELLQACLVYADIFDVKVRTQDFETATPEEIGTYDLIFMSDIVEHFLDWPTAIDKAAHLCKYCYMLIPGDRSWESSPDHITIFSFEEADRLKALFKSTLVHLQIWYEDKIQWWHMIITEGFADG